MNLVDVGYVFERLLQALSVRGDIENLGKHKVLLRYCEALPEPMCANVYFSVCRTLGALLFSLGKVAFLSRLFT